MGDYHFYLDTILDRGEEKEIIILDQNGVRRDIEDDVQVHARDLQTRYAEMYAGKENTKTCAESSARLHERIVRVIQEYVQLPAQSQKRVDRFYQQLARRQSRQLKNPLPTLERIVKTVHTPFAETLNEVMNLTLERSKKASTLERLLVDWKKIVTLPSTLQENIVNALKRLPPLKETKKAKKTQRKETREHSLEWRTHAFFQTAGRLADRPEKQEYNRVYETLATHGTFWGGEELALALIHHKNLTGENLEKCIHDLDQLTVPQTKLLRASLTAMRKQERRAAPVLRKLIAGDHIKGKKQTIVLRYAHELITEDKNLALEHLGHLIYTPEEDSDVLLTLDAIATKRSGRISPRFVQRTKTIAQRTAFSASDRIALVHIADAYASHLQSGYRSFDDLLETFETFETDLRRDLLRTLRMFITETKTPGKYRVSGKPSLRQLIETFEATYRKDPRKAQAFIEALVQPMHIADSVSTGDVTTESAAKLRGYSKLLLGEVPRVADRLDNEEWMRTLGFVAQRQTRCKDGLDVKPKERLESFTRKLFDAYQTTDPRFVISELEHVYRTVPRDVLKSLPVLEEVVLECCKEHADWEKDDVRALNKLACSLAYMKEKRLATKYNDPKAVGTMNKKHRTYSNVAHTMKEVRRSIDALPSHERKTVLDVALDIAQRDDLELPARMDCVKAYTKQCQKYLALGGDQHRVWVEHFGSVTGAEKTLERIQDDKGYHSRRLGAEKDSLSLQDIQGRLLSYAHALCGHSVKIKESPTNRFHFNGPVIQVPAQITLEGNEYDVYKSMVSLQAGAFLFGTYDLTVEQLDEEDQQRAQSDFCHSFEFPEVARGLYALVEQERLISHLTSSYPGLKRTFDAFRSYRKRQSAKCRDIVSKLERRVLGEEIPSQEESIAHHIEQAAEIIQHIRDATPEATLPATRRLYDLLSPFHDPVWAPHEPTIQHAVQTGHTTAIRFKEIEEPPASQGIFYPEWDYKKQALIDNHTLVEVHSEPPQRSRNAGKLIETHRKTIEHIRRQFEALKPEDMRKVRKQYSGLIDFDRFVQMQAELMAGITPDERVFYQKRRNTRSVCSLLLTDLSGSLGSFTNLDEPEYRVMDYIKLATVYYAEALHALGDPFGVAAFSGSSKQNVEFYFLKPIDHHFSQQEREAIQLLRPHKTNRDGAAIRHATQILEEEPYKKKFLFLMTDGNPYDKEYEGEYAIHDTAHAMIEAKMKGIIPVILAFGDVPEAYRNIVAPHIHYRRIHTPEQLPAAVPSTYLHFAQ